VLERESYNAPDLGLYHAQLSRILEGIHGKFVSAAPEISAEIADTPVLKL
jgi:hypothetical protein